MKTIEEIEITISEIFDTIKQMMTELSEDELDMFEKYMNDYINDYNKKQESIEFITDITMYNKLLNINVFSEAKNKIKLIRKLKKEI